MVALDEAINLTGVGDTTVPTYGTVQGKIIFNNLQYPIKLQIKISTELRRDPRTRLSQESSPDRLCKGSIIFT